MKTLVLIAFFIAMFIYGCKKDNNIENAALENTWILAYIKNTQSFETTTFPQDAFKELTITFVQSGDSLLFDGICNVGSGKYSYSIESDSIFISSIATTKIACKYVEWEIYTTTSLTKALTYSINGNNLEILSSGDYNLYFVKE